jgi:hypothetical protein
MSWRIPFEDGCNGVKAFFKCRLEALMKAVFICRSCAGTHNRRMTAQPVPSNSTRRTAWHLRGLPMTVVALAIGLIWPGAWAGDKADHERARAAVQAGEVLPLATVLEQLKRTHPGQVLELELEQDDGRWIYEVKLLRPDGLLLKLDVDARTAQVLKVKRKHDGKDAGQAKPQSDDRR